MATTPLRDRLKAIRDRFQSSAGSKIAPERLAPPMEVALLDEIAGRLDDLNTQFGTVADAVVNLQKRADEQVPKGLQDQKDIEVSANLSNYTPPEPLFSIDIKNDGSVSILYSINDATRDFVELEKSEGRTVSYGRAIIEKVYFKCGEGQTATVRVTGTF